MSRLLRVELFRLFSRRLIRALMALGLLLLVVVGIWVYVASDRTRFGGFHLSDLPDIFGATSIIFAATAWLVGASFMGAEWHSRTVELQLTWEPRRSRVMAAKAAAAAISVAVLAVVYQGLLFLALYPAARFRGTATVPGDFASDVFRMGGKVVFLAVFGALMGFALATIGRNTAAALGVGFAYLAVFESLLRVLFDVEVWLLGDNMGLWMVGVDPFHPGRTATDAGVLLAAYALGLTALATAIFRRRDVT